MKSTVFIFAVLFGAALAEDASSVEGTEEGRLFVGFPTLITLIQLGIQIVILLALINFVTSLKGSINFENLFDKGGDDYGGGYDTGYAPSTGYAAAPVATVGTGSSYSNYRRQGDVKRSIDDSPIVQRLTNRVYEALDSFNH